MTARKDRKDLRLRASGMIKGARQARNISQMQLASLVGVSQPLVSSWECGKVTPGIDDLVGVEQALEIPKGSLIIGIAYPTPLETGI
jgi:transcriptional regulator with XRE-family HTH domain